VATSDRRSGVKSKRVSNASRGITGKFQRPYEGPFILKEVINVYLYKLQSKSGALKDFSTSVI
jgi:hypothetical protein